MMSTTLRAAGRIGAILICLTLVAQAQICPPSPPGFDGLNGAPQGAVNHNSAILDFITGSNSSDALFSDNTAEAYMGEAIAVQFSDTRVPAGSPFTIAYSIGAPPPVSLSVPTIVDGDIWLDINNSANFFGLVDGLGLTRPFPDPLGTTAGPTNLVNLNVGVTTDPNALGVCVTFQTLVIDPLAPAPFHVAFSNAVQFGIAPVIRGINPQIAAPGTLVQMDIPGQAAFGETIFFPQGQTTLTNASQQVAVPADAISGQLSGTISTYNTLPSDDGINDYIVVTDSTVVFSNGGVVTPTPDPNLPVSGSQRASIAGTLSSATSFNTHTVSLNAGDIIEIEVYSVDNGVTRILDGLGGLLNPLAVEGFDPRVTLQQGTNLDALVWEDPQVSSGPFNLIDDDDSGPMNNAFLQWQAKWSDTYDIIIDTSNANAFLTGDYLLNIVIIPGAPNVRGFTFTGQPVNAANRVNMVQQGGTVDLVCNNLVVGRTYQVDFIPKAGAPFTTRSLTGVLATSPSVLSVTIPPAAATDLPLGLHQVRLTDEMTQLAGLVWDNSSFTPTLGVLPDLLAIIGSNVTTATSTIANANGGVIPVTSLNSETIFFQPPVLNSVNLFNGFVTAIDPGGSTIMYAEALGVAENNFLLFDCVNDTDAILNGQTNNSIYNPNLRVYPIALTNAGPYNDDDGVLPSVLFPAPMGIGFNSAIIDEFFPLSNPSGGFYDFFLDENIIFGNANNHACMVNVVIQ